MIINVRDKAAPFIQREGIINTYLNEIRKYGTLTKTEELNLIRIAQDKQNSKRNYAIEKLVNCNQRFVFSAAMSYGNNDIILDLVSEGNIGLITAIERFDFKKDIRFISYAAWWIRKYINNYLINYTNLVVPANANKLRVVVNKSKQEFYIKNQRMPTLEELRDVIKEKYDFNVKDLNDLQTYQSYSIDETNKSNDDEEAFSDSAMFTNVTATNNIDDNITVYDNKTIIGKLLKKLNKNDQSLIKKAFGIDCEEETYDTIAFDLNLTKERVRQKINEIIKKLGTMIDEKAV